MITLQPRTDGALAGEYRAWASDSGCETERTVTFTRIGDVDTNSLPDPASQAVRVASPAGAWHGRYHGTHTPDTNQVKPVSWDTSVDTHCLRTGERCISYSHNDFESDKLLFADGEWAFNYDGNVPCQAGGSPTAHVHYELPLPQPPQDPIMLLVGHGRRAVTGGGACANSYDEEWKYERTGD